MIVEWPRPDYSYFTSCLARTIFRCRLSVYRAPTNRQKARVECRLFEHQLHLSLDPNMPPISMYMAVVDFDDDDYARLSTTPFIHSLSHDHVHNYYRLLLEATFLHAAIFTRCLSGGVARYSIGTWYGGGLPTAIATYDTTPPSPVTGHQPPWLM